MKITEYFDPDNLGHLEAYKHLQRTGSWPNGFLPDGIDMSPFWMMELWNIMADKWVDFEIDRKYNQYSKHT